MQQIDKSKITAIEYVRRGSRAKTPFNVIVNWIFQFGAIKEVEITLENTADNLLI